MKEGIGIPNQHNKSFRTLTALSNTTPNEVAFFEYDNGKTSVHKTSLQPKCLLNMQDKIVPVNFTIQNGSVTGKGLDNTFETTYRATHAVRNYIEANYNARACPPGHDLEATSLLTAILRYLGIENAKLVAGKCVLENHAGLDQGALPSHTWVEIPGSVLDDPEEPVYCLDTTADQFNNHMNKKNQFPPVIFAPGRPHGLITANPPGMKTGANQEKTT